MDGQNKDTLLIMGGEVIKPFTLILTTEQKVRTLHRHNTEPSYSPFSKEKGVRIHGFAAETAILDWLNCTPKNTKDFDMLWWWFKKQWKLEVKSKQHKFTSIPSIKWDGSVKVGYDQQFDIICHCRTEWINGQLGDKVHVMSFMYKDDWVRRRIKRKKDEIDPDNGFKYKEDCWNVKYNIGWQPIGVPNPTPQEVCDEYD